MEYDKLIKADSRNELLIGCGSERSKRIGFKNGNTQWDNLITLDINPDLSPDILWDLNRIPLPFSDDSLDEIHAYEVLEHIGTQGDYKFFFAQFSEFWRILKPNGVIVGTCPTRDSVWAWGDPSHTRIIQAETFIFLSQPEYTARVGKTPMSDFRYLYKADFERDYIEEKNNVLCFALKAVKPSRISI